MPGGSRAIIIGGGINAVAPIAVGEMLFVTNLTPPEASSSPRARISSGEVIFESAAGRTDTVIGPGTASTATVNEPEVLIGNLVTSARTSAGFANVGIGANIGYTAGSDNNVIIGDQAAGVFPVGGSTGSANTHIGRVASLGGAARNSNVSVGGSITLGGSQLTVLGASATATGGNDSVVIGHAAQSTASSNVVIGKSAQAAAQPCTIVGHASGATGTTANCIILGNFNNVANLSNIIVIGHGVVVTGLAAGDIVLGNNDSQALGFSTRLVLGGANLHTSGVAVPAFSARFKNAQGTNIAAGSFTLIAPLATGNAAGGSILFQTGPAGASGAVLQTPATRLTISPNGVATFAAPTVAAENIVIDGSGGAAQASIRLNNLTNGAGAAAGTLNNAPAAGDPAFWIPISIAGVVRHVPAW